MVKLFNLRELKEKRKTLRNNLTVPEKILWKWIRNEQLGYKFRRQHSIGKYIVDFYCSQLRLVVEIDGRIHGEGENAAKDVARDKYMQQIGLHIKRFTAKDINDNLECVLDGLKNYCDECASAHTRTANPT